MAETLVQQLAALPVAERPAKKAEWIQNAVNVALAAQSATKSAYTFQRKDGAKIIIERVEYGVLDLKTNTVAPMKGKTSALWVRCSVDGTYPNGDGWYGFVNPPIQVADGTKRSVTDEFGIRSEVDNFKTDVPAALKSILGAL